MTTPSMVQLTRVIREHAVIKSRHFGRIATEFLGRRHLVTGKHPLGGLHQRGCGTSGFTLAQNPYSRVFNCSQNETGRLPAGKRVIDLIDLKPYFHGVTSRIGASFWAGIGLP